MATVYLMLVCPTERTGVIIWRLSGQLVTEVRDYTKPVVFHRATRKANNSYVRAIRKANNKCVFTRL